MVKTGSKNISEVYYLLIFTFCLSFVYNKTSKSTYNTEEYSNIHTFKESKMSTFFTNDILYQYDRPSKSLLPVPVQDSEPNILDGKIVGIYYAAEW